MRTNQEKSIALVGLMGAGKSWMGRRLASRTGWDFVDSDIAIEEESGLSIPEMFDLGGEAKFRQLELRVIRRLLAGPPIILSTGGGSFCQPDTQQAIRQGALVVWLHARPETLLGRIDNLQSRPLLSGPDPLAVMRRLAVERQPYYQQADIIVDTDGLTQKQAFDKLCRQLMRAERKQA